MKLGKIVALFAVVAFLCLSCNPYSGYQKGQGDMFYRFYEKHDSARMAAKNDVVVLSMQIATKEDSVINEFPEVSIRLQDSKYEGDIFECLSMMHIGDSATFIIGAKKYFEVYNYNQIPEFVDDKTMLWFTLKVKDIYSYEEFIDKIMQDRAQNESKELETYLLNNNIDNEPLESGLIYIETKAGKGQNPQTGQTCVMHYTGKLLDGTVFDSSVERNQPFEFTLGVGQVIKGWDEGVALMKKGGKATLIIPSALGYGANGAGNLIAPYSTLVFDVELLDIK